MNLKMTDAQKTLYYIAENMKMEKKISDEGYEHFQQAIKALEQDNEEIFKQFKKKVFLESEDILGNDMVDSYMITDYLAELLGVEND